MVLIRIYIYQRNVIMKKQSLSNENKSKRKKSFNCCILRVLSAFSSINARVSEHCRHVTKKNHHSKGGRFRFSMFFPCHAYSVQKSNQIKKLESNSLKIKQNFLAIFFLVFVTLPPFEQALVNIAINKKNLYLKLNTKYPNNRLDNSVDISRTRT